MAENYWPMLYEIREKLKELEYLIRLAIPPEVMNMIAQTEIEIRKKEEEK